MRYFYVDEVKIYGFVMSETLLIIFKRKELIPGMEF